MSLTNIKLKYTPKTIYGYTHINFDVNGAGDLGLFAIAFYDRDGERGRRLVACWNACAGIDTEQLEEHPTVADFVADQVVSMQEQRDDLLAAIALAGTYLVAARPDTALGVMRDAIAKVKRRCRMSTSTLLYSTQITKGYSEEPTIIALRTEGDCFVCWLEGHDYYNDVLFVDGRRDRAIERAVELGRMPEQHLAAYAARVNNAMAGGALGDFVAQRDELVSQRDELLAVLKQIVTECMDFPPVKPYSGDSYLPPHLLDAAQAAVANAEGDIARHPIGATPPLTPPARDIKGDKGARDKLLADIEAHQRKAAIAAVEVRS